MGNYNNVDRKSIVSQKGFSVKKRFSQNFLLDENIITNIIAGSDIDENTGVIEIGPGLGALTKQILEKAKQTLLYEIDRDLIPHLEAFFKDSKNWTLLNKDVLKADINEDILGYFKEVNRIVVISNLPYHITTPIIMKFLEEVENIDSLVLMMQLEVGKRLTSKPNTKDYNALSVIIQHQTDAKYLFKVPRTVFHPRPNVDSAVVRLDIKKDIKNSEYQDFYRFVHNCFLQRRKTLVNNLNFAYNFPKDDIKMILVELGLDPLARSESLELEDFLRVYDLFNKDLRG
ncbi:MAG: 16S rRNA (adenine(1518)-N(6)/adenine(1519)-N(6))-dimethyltransferase RsmA [Tenericutes bacterium]|nr:16S rRNA (adenine(1518)-N(6)/adenine(1519)-N(6))-dimethyltransferase RsmA [Mycoplasmatota bacterium]